MYKCNQCGKLFEKPIVKGDLEEDIAVCPHCDSEWIKEVKMAYKIGRILVDKLTSDELELLCDAHEDGSLDDVFYNDLYPVDERNHPEKYVNPADNN